jgi:hypothetical protein
VRYSGGKYGSAWDGKHSCAFWALSRRKASANWIVCGACRSARMRLLAVGVRPRGERLSSVWIGFSIQAAVGSAALTKGRDSRTFLQQFSLRCPC